MPACPTPAIKRVHDFVMMYLAILATDEQKQIEELPPDEVALSVSGCGASDQLTVENLRSFVEEFENLDLRRRKIREALESPPERSRTDPPLQGPSG